MIVLYWISGDPKRWKTFVSNKIGAILEQVRPRSGLRVGNQLDLHLYNRPTIARQQDHRETPLLRDTASTTFLSLDPSGARSANRITFARKARRHASITLVLPILLVNRNCSQCGQGHHTLLHFPNAQESPSLTSGVSQKHASDSDRSADSAQNAPSTQLLSAVTSQHRSSAQTQTAPCAS